MHQNRTEFTLASSPIKTLTPIVRVLRYMGTQNRLDRTRIANRAPTEFFLPLDQSALITGPCLEMVMNVIEMLRREQNYNTLDIQEDRNKAIYWCNMHADLIDTPGRACFRPQLLEDLHTYIRHLPERMNLLDDSAANSILPHVVLASSAKAFNLGGDLALFCRSIREKNRNALENYARQCVTGLHAFHTGLGIGAHTIALVQGDALGGGFEAALGCNTIVAESGVGMGFPEVLFDLYPGMGAYSFMCQRISPYQAEKLMLDGNIYSSDELYKMGLVDVLVPHGQGIAAVEEVIRNHRRIPHARRAMHKVRQQVTLEELMRITDIWVDTAMQLGEKSLRTMERLVKAQVRQGVEHAVRREAML
jgi:DSF synthase